MLKKLSYTKGAKVVTVYPEEEEVTNQIGTFVHEDNIEPFSSVKFPVLKAHVYRLLREDKNLDPTQIDIVPGYDIKLPVELNPEPVPMQERNGIPFDEDEAEAKIEKQEDEAEVLVPAGQPVEDQGDVESKLDNGGQGVSLVPAEGISFDESKTELNVGDTFAFKAKVLPAEATNQKLNFESSDPEVVRITPKGKATALKEGTATIGVQSEDGEFTETIDVTVAAVA